ncbi:MAG: hypothetical protein A2152_02820 [Candidatus Levybacteria bacterium RBG_16_35_6]|nr:MAG: hypothetical protein A2152_02820 [Candidatus Levybacteria bacterium RBG_16_35_6]
MIKFKIQNLILPLILLVSAFLRLYRIGDYMTFLGDEGRDALIVYNILHGKLTLLGPTASVGGFFLGPIYYYFMAVFTLLFNYNPIGPSIMVALFGIATVWLIYKVCKEFFNYKVGLVASFLYAISPIVISYSRSSWNPNPLPFFALLSLYVLYKAVKKNKWFLFVINGLILGIAVQLHYLTLFLIVIVLAYVLFARFFVLKKTFNKNLLRTLENYLFIIVGFVIGWLPFLAFEVRHGFPNIISIFNFIFSSGKTGAGASFFSNIYDVFFRIFGRFLFSFPPIEQLTNYNKNLLSFWQAVILIFALFSVYILTKKIWENKKDKEELLKYGLIAIWFFIGIILFGFYKKSIYEYYFGFMFPLPFILIAISLVSLSKVKFGKIISLVIFVGIILINIQGVPFRYIPNRQLNQAETIAQFVLDKSDNKPFNFALITGGNSDYAYRYFFTIWNHPPVTIEQPANDPQRRTVTGQLLVVCESLPCEPLGNSLWEIAGFGRAEIAGSWDVSVVKVYRLVPYSEK